MRRFLLALALCLPSIGASAIFDQPAPFFGPLTAQTPPPLIPLSIDGTPQSYTGTSATPTVTITTAKPNEVLLMAVSILDGTPTSVVTAGLTWVQRAVNHPGSVGEVEEWYAYAPAAGTYVVTVTVGPTILNTIIVAAVVGSSIGNTFDSNASLPAYNSGDPSNAATVSTFISTTHGNDMLIEIYDSGVSVPLPPTGFSDLGSVGNLGFSYKIVASPQSSLIVTTGSGFVAYVATDAVRGN